MTHAFVKLSAALALAAASLAAQASGNVVVVNETDNAIHPFFRSNCWGITVSPGTNGWVFFGGIGPRGQFGWDFTTIVDPTCKKPVVEFTYTIDPDVSQPAKHPSVYQKLHYSPTTNFYMQNGDRIQSYNLLNDDDEDDDHDGDGHH
jgi:hypothetical protein